MNVPRSLRAVEVHAAHRFSHLTIKARGTCRPASDRPVDERRVQAELVGDKASEEEMLANHFTARLATEFRVNEQFVNAGHPTRGRENDLSSESLLFVDIRTPSRRFSIATRARSRSRTVPTSTGRSPL